MRDVTVFYSWQSDRPSNLCKNFIKLALDQAAELLNADAALGVTVVIDSDTQGIPGTPPVNDTILRKIESCDVFAPDVTFVAKTEDGKLIPNPNVMAEYGYALHAKTHEAMLPVMNIAFGPPDKLPFDMHHFRHPAQYTAAESITDAARRKERDRLASELKDRLKLIIQARSAPKSKPDIPDDMRERWDALSQYHALYDGDPPTIVSQPLCSLIIVPLKAVDGSFHIDPRQIKSIEQYLVPPWGEQSSTQSFTSSDGWWWYGLPKRVADLANPASPWLSHVTHNGVIAIRFTIGQRIQDDPTIVVRGEELEQRIVAILDRLAQAARILGIDGPVLLACSFRGVSDVELFPQPPTRGRPFKIPSIILPNLELATFSPPVGNHMRPSFDRLWMAAGVPDGAPSFQTDMWAGYHENME